MTPEVKAAWEEYAQHRKELRKPLTPTAIKRAMRKVEELSLGNPRRALAIIEQSMEENWIGVHPLSKENEERFQARERDRMRMRSKPCEYCGKEITESKRLSHEDSECPNFRRADPKEVTGAINLLTEKWKAN